MVITAVLTIVFYSEADKAARYGDDAKYESACKISMISTIVGFVIWGVTFVIWFIRYGIYAIVGIGSLVYIFGQLMSLYAGGN